MSSYTQQHRSNCSYRSYIRFRRKIGFCHVSINRQLFIIAQWALCLFSSDVVSDLLTYSLIFCCYLTHKFVSLCVQDPDGAKWRRLVPKTADNSRRLRVAAGWPWPTEGHQSCGDARTLRQRTGRVCTSPSQQVVCFPCLFGGAENAGVENTGAMHKNRNLLPLISFAVFAYIFGRKQNRI